jgi:quercetin dioxygenase-like cupin family protein
MPITPPKEVIRIGQLEVQFRLEAAETGGAFTMFELHVPPAARVPLPHSHENFEETVYGLEGTMTFMVAGHPTTLGPGDVLHIPRGVVHGFDNRGTTPTRALSLITPGILGPAYFKEIAAAIVPGSPPDPARIREVMQRHGLRPVPAA